MVNVVGIFSGLFGCPGDVGPLELAQHRATGSANGRLAESPRFRTVVPELIHVEGVRYYDERHVPGLALAASELTVSPGQLLLSAPMERLRP